MIALMAFSDVSELGVLVQSLMTGIMPTFILLDNATALELATVPVATRLVGAAVVAIGTGVVNAPQQ